MRVSFLILFISLNFISKLTTAQASSSTDFSFEIQLLTETTVDDYEFYLVSYSNGINHYSNCFISTDTISGNAVISGHISYIVGGDNLELIIAKKGKLEAEKYHQRFETRKNYFLRISQIGRIKHEVSTIHLNENKPIIETDGEFINKEYVIHTNYFDGPTTEYQQMHLAHLLTMEKWLIVPIKND